MIVRFMSEGRSFKGTVLYATHDPDRAKTSNRVEFTHCLNTANDHVPSAVDELYWTAKNAEALKADAGVRGGGRKSDNPVKHISLNWHPSQNPSKEHMIATAEEFLAHMGWQDHQAIIVAHNDKPYKHLHIILNAIHPETGLKLDDGNEYIRAQRWGKRYELDQGQIFCEQRFLRARNRVEAAPHHVWSAFKKNESGFSKIENQRRAELRNDDAKSGRTKDPAQEKLQKILRDRREAFFAEGKQEFQEMRAGIF